MHEMLTVLPKFVVSVSLSVTQLKLAAAHSTPCVHVLVDDMTFHD